MWVYGLFLFGGFFYAVTIFAATDDQSQDQNQSTQTSSTAPSTSETTMVKFYIKEYRVEGAHQLKPLDIEKSVYPFLGPERTSEDVEKARAALEQAFKDKGFQTVTVEIPSQSGRRGVVILKVVENTVGRLRVKGSRYFLPSDIKRKAPSIQEGKVPDFNEVSKDIIALNQHPDLRVTPVLRAGVEPGTVDIDLNVADKMPLHGSIEINNRYSVDTTELRVNGSISYNNLWQLGHTAGFSFQIAPERLEDAEVFSAYYSARIPGVDGLNLMLQATKQNSDVSTLGGAAVAGKGEVIGARAMIALPSGKSFYQSLTLGFDYKRFDENVLFGGEEISTPIAYYPLSAFYGATWTGKKGFTEFNTGVTFHLRGMGSDTVEFDNKRYNADGAFIYLKGDISHTHDLPGGFQVFAKTQGQIAGQPLINSEQIAAGGLSTVRGYLEATSLGDNGLFGTVELRSPSLLFGAKDKDANEWRVYAFLEGGYVTLNDPLPDQVDRFELASIGVGSRLKIWNHLNGSVDLGFPMISQGTTLENDLLVTFRLWADF